MDVTSEEEKFSTAFNTSPNAIVLTRFPGGQIIEVNNGFLSMSGYSYADILGKTTLEIGLWDKEEDEKRILKELFEFRKLHRVELKFRKKSGDVILCLLSAEVISVGNEKCLLSTIDDITERKKYSEVISYERNLLRTLLDNLPDPVTIKDHEGHYLLNNKAHLDVIGAKSQEEVFGKTTFDFFAEEEARIYDEDDKKVLATGKMILDKVEKATHVDTGFTYWHLTSKIPIQDSNSNTKHLLTLSHDITKRKLAEDALRESAEFNRSLLKTIPFGMDIVDEDGTILFQSENFRNIFGPEAIGKKCWEVYRDDKLQCSDCPLTRGIKKGITEIYESRGNLDGKTFDIYHTGMMFHGKKAMLEIFHDISERKHVEYELTKSKEKAEESDKLKTAFLHNISHEIRTPMNAIIGFSALLGEPDISAEDHKSYLEILVQSSNHLLSIVTDIIEISNIEAGTLKCKMNDINLGSLLESQHIQFKPRAAEKGIELRLKIPSSDNIANFVTDRTKLVQVIANLLSNALKFTSKGHIEFGYNLRENMVEFFVSDTGIGIPEDQQLKIFERFYQVDNRESRLYEGTGLGLSLTKAYIEFLGGNIWVKSEVGKGSTFYFTVPYKENETKAPSERKSVVPENPKFDKNVTILVAEDNDINFSLITHFLSDPQIKIIRACNGQEAVDFCKSGEDIHLVLMDLKMHVMNGFNATRIIKDLLPGLPVIAQTAFITDKEKALECGCSDIITKPFNREHFYSIIKKYL
jgi:PAS domain S-box-containing protein